MAKNYFHGKEWKKYRALCLEKSGHCCERCLSKGILQIHHPDYKEGLKPWEYPVEFCEVLCRKCHAEIHGKIPPSGGWIVLHSDLEDNQPSEIVPCDYCNTDITWHFTIYHPEWGEMVVGSECAENLSLGTEVKNLKSYQRRLKTFIVSPRWVPTNKGFRITYQNYSILIFRKGDKYRIKIDDEWGKFYYETLEGAKITAFKVVDFRINK